MLVNHLKRRKREKLQIKIIKHKLALEGLTNEQVRNTIIAYEPIWAIGTGKTATSEDANNSIKCIRQNSGDYTETMLLKRL